MERDEKEITMSPARIFAVLGIFRIVTLLRQIYGALA
jgi:hypothetical protein